MTNKLNRREFTRICGSMIAMAGTLSASPAPAQSRTAYNRSRLIGSNKKPLTATSLAKEQAYLFFYPYITTPCFLINLATSTEKTDLSDNSGKSYEWHGGTGQHNSIVAYSAICSHKMSHPAKEISFINYRHDSTSFFSHEGEKVERSGVISCCSERSVYDPADGARVLSGPAPQPLAAIELDIDPETDFIYATASYGADMYERFFEKFGFRAAMEHRVTDPKTLAGNTTTVRKTEDYSSQTIKC